MTCLPRAVAEELHRVAHHVHKSEVVTVALVGNMAFLAHHYPYLFIYLWEKGIGLRRSVIDTCQIQTLGEGYGLGIEAGTADDEHLTVAATGGQGLLQRAKDLGPRSLEAHLSRENNVATVGQRALGQRLPCSASHNDGVASGEAAKTPHILRQPIQKFVVIANGTILGHGSNK